MSERVTGEGIQIDTVDRWRERLRAVSLWVGVFQLTIRLVFPAGRVG